MLPSLIFIFVKKQVRDGSVKFPQHIINDNSSPALFTRRFSSRERAREVHRDGSIFSDFSFLFAETRHFQGEQEKQLTMMTAA